ncbi:MAG: hypothetical protein SNJ82_10355 [Gemmataceae bacterium]
MSDEVRTSSGTRWILLVWVAVPLFLLLAVVLAILWQTPRYSRTSDDKDPTHRQTNELAAVRATLNKQDDVNTCKSVITKLNAHLRQAPEHSVPELSPADRARFQAEFRLNEEDLAEVASTTFTMLDAHHLATCLLLRDAARSLEITAPAAKGVGVVRLTPLQRAQVAFDWVNRQIRLQGPTPEPAPVAFTLRRGWGSPLERALVYLALLEQYGLSEDDNAGLQGCLLLLPAKDREPPRLWACGVAFGTKPDALYLFDPRIGLAIPGPDGKGVATLAQAQNDPKVLAQLDTPEQKYDVTAADAKAAEIELVVPLSAISTRMMLLQNTLLRERTWQKKSLPAPIRVRLAENPAIVRAIIQSAAKEQKVRFAADLCVLLSRSLSRDEGGTDRPQPFDLATIPGFATRTTGLVASVSRQQLLLLLSTPWRYFPRGFANTDEFSLYDGAGRDLRAMFQGATLRYLEDPNSPREAILRGRVGSSTSEGLVKERETWQIARQRTLPEDQLRAGIERWIADTNRVRAQLLQGEISETQGRDLLNKLFRFRSGDPMDVLMSHSIGTARAIELTYQLGLCMQERAIRDAARAALSAQTGVKLSDEERRAQEAYRAAEGWWRESLSLFPNAATVPAVRRLRGEALWALGQKDEARAMWKDIPPVFLPVERVTGPWLMRQN